MGIGREAMDGGGRLADLGGTARLHGIEVLKGFEGAILRGCILKAIHVAPLPPHVRSYRQPEALQEAVVCGATRSASWM